MKNLIKLAVALVVTSLIVACAPSDKKYVGYLFVYFTGNGAGEEQLHYALSSDGYNFRALNHDQAVINSDDISSTGGIRDPHLLRGEDGKFYMVLTDLKTEDMGWTNTAMVMLKSDDLIHWTHSVVNIPALYPAEFGNVNRVWAPQTIFDAKAKKYMVYFSLKQGDGPDTIYYSYANQDFTGLETAPKQLYSPPEDSNTRATIDGDIIAKDGKFYLFYKGEDGEPGIKLAISDQLTEGYKLNSSKRVDKETSPVEGSGIFKLIGSDTYILMYDLYTSGQYKFAKSKDLINFEAIDQDISMDFHPRHGSVIAITQAEVDALMAQWGGFDDAVATAAAPQVKKLNIVIDNKAQTIFLPLKPDTNLTAFDPEFVTLPGAKLTPAGAQDFSKGALDYQLSVNGQTKTYKVNAAINNNPVLSGYYADPEIIYSKKTGKYYLYPTTDGFPGWSGTYFQTFSSPDLVHWTNEGTIVDLKKDVSWADRNAWAPTAIEREVDGQYKYYFYFTAAQKVGVAVADNPAGPFVDSGKPLVNFRPMGITGGQEIDPDVFHDPVSGKNYLYWGNGYMAVAELNDDMVSLDRATVKVMTPDATFREGTEVFYRNGKYYFLWSENDTGEPDYRVRYATSDSPTGPLTIPADNLVIARNDAEQIYGTGHNSVINKPGTDEWFIVYHRFTRPKGITMGGDAGSHREVCIDKLTFNEDGSIVTVTSTLEGITP